MGRRDRVETTERIEREGKSSQKFSLLDFSWFPRNKSPLSPKLLPNPSCLNVGSDRLLPLPLPPSRSGESIDMIPNAKESSTEEDVIGNVPVEGSCNPPIKLLMLDKATASAEGDINIAFEEVKSADVLPPLNDRWADRGESSLAVVTVLLSKRLYPLWLLP